jgi:hypothetical protein
VSFSPRAASPVRCLVTAPYLSSYTHPSTTIVDKAFPSTNSPAVGKHLNTTATIGHLGHTYSVCTDSPRFTMAYPTAESGAWGGAAQAPATASAVSVTQASILSNSGPLPVLNESFYPPDRSSSRVPSRYDFVAAPPFIHLPVNGYGGQHVGHPLPITNPPLRPHHSKSLSDASYSPTETAVDGYYEQGVNAHRERNRSHKKKSDGKKKDATSRLLDLVPKRFFQMPMKSAGGKKTKTMATADKMRQAWRFFA